MYTCEEFLILGSGLPLKETFLMTSPSKIVLIIDDDFEDRYFYSRYLEKSSYSYKIIESETAEKGLDIAWREKPDIILLDFVLPGMNGLEFIEELKANADFLPPVIMLTGGGNETIAIEAMKAGVKDYLLKDKINADSLCCAVRNVLEQDRLQKLAERNENRFRVCVENLLDCLAIYTIDRDRQGRIIGFHVDYLNKAASQSDLFQQQALIDRATVFKPEAELFALCCQVVETGKSISQEYVYRRSQPEADLATVYEIRINKLEDGFVAVWRDISDCQQIAKAFKQSEENFRILVTQAPIGIFQTDSQGDCNYVNPRWSEITGLSFEEAKGKGWSKALHPDDRANIYQEWYRAAKDGKEFALEYRFQNKGKVTWVSGRAVAITNDNGEQSGYFGTIVDISDRKQTENILARQRKQLVHANQNLEQATNLFKKRNQELDEFTHIVSHDLKAPLRAISNLSVWIEEDLDDRLDDDTRKNLELLRSRVSRMQTFIESLLRYAKVGKEKMPKEIVVVKDLLADVVDSLAAPQTFKIVIEGVMPTLNTQKIRLQQVFSNLISNSIKHHPTQVGKVIITCKEDSEFCHFSVTDDGQGIAKEHSQRIFGIFQTLASKDNSESTGIGLSIVKKIVESQGGTIQLESELGKGSTFYFSWRK